MINLINGYLRTPKVAQFNKRINWINNTNNRNIATYDYDTSSILNNSWGFIDADGSFSIVVREKNSDGKGKTRVEARARIEQRQVDPKTGKSYQFVLESISKVFCVRLGTTIHNGDISYYVIAITSPAKLSILINYLEKYPLFSSKFLN